MKHIRKDMEPKGWYVGPWNSDVQVPVGYANRGIDEKHYHEKLTEIYLVASGTGTAVIDGKEVVLSKGDVLVPDFLMGYRRTIESRESFE